MKFAQRHHRTLQRQLVLFAAILAFSAGGLAQERAETGKDPASTEMACKQAQSQIELNQCSEEQYRRADERLNHVYRKALEFMQKDLFDARRQKDAEEEKYDQASI
jgi:uncharacterized protein YecT (DUF1311 family)